MEIYAADSKLSEKRSSVSSSSSSSSSSSLSLSSSLSSSPMGRQYDSRLLVNTPTSPTSSASLLSATTLTMEACCITEDDIQYSFTKQSEAVRKLGESSVRKLDESSSSSSAAVVVIASSSFEVESYSQHYEDESYSHHQQVESKYHQKQLFPSSKSVFHSVHNECCYCDAKDKNNSSIMQHNDNHHLHLHHHQSAEISLLTTITEGTESSTVSTVEWPIYPKILRKQQQLVHDDDNKYDDDDFKADYKNQDRVDYK